MKRHKWYNEIVAWADGAQIEYRGQYPNGTWNEWTIVKYPSWDDDHEGKQYRIKSQSPSPQYLYVISDNCGNLRITKDKDDVDNLDNSFDSSYIGKIKLEVDDE